MSRLLIALGGVAVVAALAANSRGGLAGVPYKMDPSTVFYLSDQLAHRYYPSVNPLMMTAMAEIESSYRPGAIRYESHINDASIGLMQTLYGTARWLHDDMGYKAYQLVNADSLMDPQTSLYFGGAMINWLRSYAGTIRSDRWIVESYNGGPGNSNGQTRHHYSKWLAAMRRLEAAGIGDPFLYVDGEG